MSSIPSRTTSSSSLSHESEASKSSKSKRIETHWLLNDFEFLDHVCQRSKGLVDFPFLLFAYFEANDKGADLLKWAIEKEAKETKDPNSILSNDETIANRLVHHLFCSDLGARYLSNALSPILKEIISACNKDQNGDKISSKKNVQWITGLLKSFLESMEENVFECPVLIRESFMQLHQVLARRIPNPYEVTAGAFFLNFISPVLRAPTNYSFFTEHKAIQPNTYKMFKLASQIFNSLVSGNIDYNTFGKQCKLVKEFSQFASERIKDFAKLLTDEKAIKMSKTVIRASSRFTTKGAKEDAVTALRQYLDTQEINQKIESEVDYKCRLDHMLDLYKSSDWKTAKTSKKYGIIAYSKKIEGSPILSFKTVARVALDFNAAVAVLQDTPETYLLDPRITEATITKKNLGL